MGICFELKSVQILCSREDIIESVYSLEHRFNCYYCTLTFTPSQHGMIPLSGAQLHKSVDIAGQALQPDLKSGRQEDRLAFRLSFVSNESLYFRVARPNELKGWVERLEKVRERGRKMLQ